MTTIDDFVTDHRVRMLEELKELLRIPSISTDPAHSGDCRRAAVWLADHLRALGCRSVQLRGGGACPVVHGEGPRVPGQPTVLVYGHYDVQPPGSLDDWASPPFEPEERDGNLFARGATDDKGQVFAILKAFEAVMREGHPPVNVRFLLEGQEESGGEVILNVVRTHPALLKADAAVVADGPYYAPGWPSVEVGVRGICYAEITVRVLEADLHSGLYGGVAPNAHEVLVHLLASLKAPGGKNRIPGVLNAVRRPHPRELAAWKRLPFDTRAFQRRELRARAMVGDARYSVHERIWARPTLEIHGITGGFTGPGVMTVIPGEARAKVSLRLVPDQKATTVFQQLTRAVKAAAPPFADVNVRLLTAADPVLVDVDHPALGHIQRAFHEVVGRSPVFVRSGGSLPILGELGRRGAAVVVAGIGLPDDGLHSANEKLRLEQFLNGIRVYARFLTTMATYERGGVR